MISPLYAGYAVLGGVIQLAVIWLMRARGWPFWWVAPAILVHQFLFTTAYAKAPNFTLQWFLTGALTGLASFILGVTVFGDRLSLMNTAGVLMVFGGLALMRFG